MTLKCARCKTPVIKSKVKGYSGYACPKHDEDLFNFEMVSE